MYKIVALAEGTTSILDDILGAVPKVVEFSGTMLTTMLANSLYLFLFAGSMVGIGISIFRRFKRAASGS